MKLSTHFARAALIASLGLGLSLPALASAQGRGAPDGPPAGAPGHPGCGPHGHGHGHHRGWHDHMHALLDQLGLTQNQKDEIRAIFETSRDRMREIRAEGRSKETFEKKRALADETRSLVLDVLTPAQRTKLAELKQARQEERLDARMDRMTEHLSLTPTQARKIRAIFERTQARRQALRNGNADPDTRRAQMRALFDETRTAIDAVLTPEQREKAQAFMERHHHRGHGTRFGR